MEFIIGLLALVGMGFIFQKAGRAVWEGIVPFYNIYVATQVCGKPWWWIIIIFFVPVANIILWALLCHEIAKGFNKGILWTILLLLVPFIAFPYLGFAKSENWVK